MTSTGKLANDLKWNSRQRMQYIEVMAFYTGSVSRSDVAQTFGLSDAAATKELKLYNDLAPGNLNYQHTFFGFCPTEAFTPLFADLTPNQVLPMLTNNLASQGTPDSNLIYGLQLDTLPLPSRLPSKEVLAPITRAIKQKKKIAIRYHSLSSNNHNQGERIIEPHSLVNTGQRWHVRAYQEESYDFRDFVLSRIETSQLLEINAESGIQYDDDWVEQETLQLSPHPGLNEKQRDNLLFDYGCENGVIEITVRRALIGYLFQRLSIDTTPDHSLNPSAFPLILVNRDQIEAFAGWAFLKKPS